MKILLVLDSYYPKIDGPHNVITNYAECFNTHKNIHAEVVVPSVKNYFDVQKFVVRRVKSLPAVEGYNMGLAQFDRKLKKFLKNNQFDIIHVHSPFTLGRYFINYGRRYKIPTVFTFHTAFKEDFERVLKRNWQRKFAMNYIMKTINLADCVLSVSNGSAEVLKSYGFNKPISVIRNGTDFVYPENAQSLIDDINQKHNLAPDDLVFLSVGRIVQNKRLDVVIDALKILWDSGQKFKFFVMGDGAYRQELQSKVASLGLDQCILFLGRIEQRTDMIPYYLRANLLLFPSTFDTASLAPIEAAALKLPTLLTRGAPTAEIVTDGQNGYLAGQTAQEWADALAKIIANRPALEQMREACWQQVAKSWNAVSDEVLQKYQDIINMYQPKN